MTTCPLTPARCQAVRRELQGFLKGPARTWWDANEDTLTDLTTDELRDLIDAMRSGRHAAKHEMASLAYMAQLEAMSLKEWKGARDANVERLKAIAERRRAAARAFLELGWLALRALWQAIRRVTGL